MVSTTRATTADAISATVPFPKLPRPRRRRPLASQPPVILRSQPYPIDVRVNRLAERGVVFSTISRSWANGDERKCRLCDRCSAIDGRCLISVSALVFPDEAPLFSTLGFRRTQAFRGMDEGGAGFKVVEA